MDISKIDSSLSHGRFLSGKRLIILNISLVIACLLPLITVLIFITILAGGMEWSNDMTFGLIGGNAFSLFLFGAVLWVRISNNKLKKNILLWLEDAIELKAFVKRLDIVSPQYKPYQIQVEFEIDGKKQYRISAPGGIVRGYHKIFAKYDNKRIKILFSPKNDEVLILKN